MIATESRRSDVTGGLGYRPDEIRVLQIGSEWLPEHTGGLQRMHYEIHRHLPRHAVSSYGLVAGSAAIEEATEGRVFGVVDPGAPLMERLRRFRGATKWAVDEFNPDLISSHFSLYTLPTLDLVRRYPFVAHLHGPWALESKREGQRRTTTFAKRVVERAVYRNGTSFIVLSHAFKKLFSEEYHVPEERISVIPAGVKADEFDTGLTRREAATLLGWETDRPIVFAVRRLVERMGLDTLIRSIRSVSRIEPDILVHIAGKGPLKEQLQEQIEVQGLENHVRLLGFVPEDKLAYAYRAAELSIVPTSSLEGMGCITLESLAAGTPVLVTPVGGLPEVVSPLSQDLLLEDASVGAIAAGITEALSGKRTLPSSLSCQKYVRKHFDWDVVVGEVARTYRQALHG